MYPENHVAIISLSILQLLMATIIPVKRKKGVGYQAIIRKKGQKPIKKTFDTKGQANFWAQEQESLIYAKRYRDPRLADKVTLSEALEKYKVHSEKIEKKAASTLEREKFSRKHLERILGAETALSEITTAIVSEYQTTRINEQSSASCIRQELSMLSKMYRKASIDWGLPVTNPVDGIERIPPGDGRERFLTETEAAIIIDEAKACRNQLFFPWILLLMHTGMRSGEAASLHKDCIDFEKRTILIKKTKSGKPRKIPLTVRACDALKMVTPKESGHFFLKQSHLSNDKVMLSPGCIFKECWNGVWDRIERKIKDKKYPAIDRLTIHDIRHTAASHLLAAGVDARIIADILGHSTLQMIMRYTHVFEETKIDTIDKLNNLGFVK